MSYWTHINGTIAISAIGRTQHEMRYIIESVLEHLPDVTGSEENMSTYVIQANGYNEWSSHNEFGIHVPHRDNKCQSKYLLVVDGDLRDRLFDQTLREFTKFLTRLSKRLSVVNILVSLKSYDKEYIFKDHKIYADMFESPSWVNETGEPAWWEYLMWDRGVNTERPMSLEYKYFQNPENDAEWNRRKNLE